MSRLFGASFTTLLRRTKYGGRKAVSAKKRLKKGISYRHPKGGSVFLRMRDGYVKERQVQVTARLILADPSISLPSL